MEIGRYNIPARPSKKPEGGESEQEDVAPKNCSELAVTSSHLKRCCEHFDYDRSYLRRRRVSIELGHGRWRLQDLKNCDRHNCSIEIDYIRN